MFLIIITGLPCTGKTTLGRKIAKEFQLPFVSKDDFKEILFDSLGFSDREWSKKIGRASYRILYHIAEQNLKVNKSLILETNFNPKLATLKFIQLKEKYNFTSFQIRCITDGEILFERFKKRANSKERHLGHVDNNNIGEFKYMLKKGKIDALEIGGNIYDIDTTNFENINYKKLFAAIKNVNHFGIN